MLNLQHLSAGYGEKTILHDISLNFPAGTVTAILGPNGCGKSTLLRAAAGLLPLSAGTAAVEGPVARAIAYLPQSRPVPDMTAQQLVLHGRFPWLSWPRRYRETDIAIARAAMDRLGIGEFADRPLGELSGGTRQKCFLAMALAQEAPTLLLDEPTSFLDVGHQLKLMALCRCLAAEGKAVALVLHDLPHAFAAADKIVVMEGGRAVAQGTPAEVLSSGCIEEVFVVRLSQVDTPHGPRYYLEGESL